MKFLNKIALLSFMVAVLGAFNCDEPVPLEELNTAKVALSEAEMLRADKYATTEYTKAKNHMFTAMDKMGDGSNGDAKSEAEAAAKLAKEAFDIAGPKATKEMQDEAEELRKKAKAAYAEKLAPEDYQSGQDGQVAGKSARDQKDWKLAYTRLESAKESFQKALSICLAQKSQLENTVQEIENNISQAEKYEAKKYAPKSLAMAKKKLKVGKEALAKDDLETALPAIAKAKEASEKALQKSLKVWLEKKYASASQKTAQAEMSLSEFKKNYSESMDKFSDVKYDVQTQEENLKAAKNALASAQNYYSNQQYEEAYKQSEEAENLAKIILEQIPNIQNKLIEYMNQECQAGTKKDKEGKYCDPIDQGKEIVKDVTDENSATGTGKPPYPKGWKTYKVKYKKYNKDCLWRIASYKYIYNNKKLWPRIYKANKSKIKHPDIIYPGQVFAIPPKTGNINSVIAYKNSYNKKLKEWYASQKSESSSTMESNENSSEMEEDTDEESYEEDSEDEETSSSESTSDYVAPNSNSDEEPDEELED